jgi:hypothetical protein
MRGDSDEDLKSILRGKASAGFSESDVLFWNWKCWMMARGALL